MDLKKFTIEDIGFDFINNNLIKFKKQLLIKLTQVNIPFGIEDYKNKLYLTIETNEDTSIQLNLLEENIKNKYLDFLQEIKNTVEIELNDIDLTLNSFIKKKNEKTSLIKFKIKTYRNKPIINISNNKSCFEIEKNSKCDVILNIEGIWNFNNSFGLLAYIKTINFHQNEC